MKNFSKPDIEKILAENFKNLDFFFISFFIYYFLPISLAVLELLLSINNLDLFGYEVNLFIIFFLPSIDFLFLIAFLLLLLITF